MAEQLVTMGVAREYVPGTTSFIIISDGLYQVHAYIPKGVTVVIGRAYTVHKQGNTYFVGVEVDV
jgi:hypothetical protein